MTRRTLAAVGVGLVGLIMLGYGVLGLLTSEVKPTNWARFFVYGLAGHDGLIGAAVAAVATGLALLARRLPAHLRRAITGPVVGGLIVSGSLALVALPLLTGIGRDPFLPSALPLDYGRGLGVLLAVVWVGVALIVAARLIARRARRGGAAPPRPAQPRPAQPRPGQPRPAQPRSAQPRSAQPR